MIKSVLFFKTFFFEVVFLLIIQSCTNHSLVVNPTTDLTGKIKNSSFSTPNFDNIYNAYFEYNTNGEMDNFTMALDTIIQCKYKIIRENNKFIFRDSAGLTGMTFYLQYGTNWADSIYVYDTNHPLDIIRIERDDSNNILKIYNTVTTISNFVYNNGDIQSYEAKMLLSGAVYLYTNYIFEYDNSKLKKSGANPNHLLESFENWGIVLFDIDNFGLKVGNTNTHAISSIKYQISSSMATPITSDSSQFNYSTYTLNSMQLEIFGNLVSRGNINKVENTYY